MTFNRTHKIFLENFKKLIKRCYVTVFEKKIDQMSIQRRSQKMVDRALKTKIDLSKVKTTPNGNHYVEVNFKEKKKYFKFCAEITCNEALFNTTTIKTIYL